MSSEELILKKNRRTRRGTFINEVTARKNSYSQHYPPGAQNIFKEFPTNNTVTENGKELYFPKGGRGFEGEPGVPPSYKESYTCSLPPNLFLALQITS